jgi:hypothetical protein
MRSGVHLAIADMITGHGNRKEPLRSLHIAIGDADLVTVIYRMKFGTGAMEMWMTERENGELSDKILFPGG